MNARPYYLSFVEAFLKELRLSSLSVLSSRQIDEYFRRTGSQKRFIVWQFRQSVEAIQLLLVDLAQVSTGNHVDWDFWKEASKALEFHDPTLAKERALKDRIGARSGGPKFAGCAKALFLLESLARSIRSRDYPIDAVHAPRPLRSENQLAEG